MNSKEAMTNPISEDSSGSSSLSQSAYSHQNNSLLSKDISLNNGDVNNSSVSNGKGSVSDDENEGGYTSGKEEFEPALENPFSSGPGGESVGEVTGEGNSVGSFVDASGNSLTKDDALLVSRGSMNDDDVENVNKVCAAVDDTDKIKLSGVEDSEGKAEFLNSVEKFDVNLEMKREEKVISEGDLKLTPEGDSIIDSIQVDTAGRGVVVVGDSEEKIGEEIETVDFPVESEVGVVENETTGDLELTPEGDSIVDFIQVDVASPGVAVVGESEENTGAEFKGVEVPVESVGTADVSETDGKCDPDVGFEPTVVSKAIEKGFTMKIDSDDEEVETDSENVYVESKSALDPQEITQVEDEDENEVDDDENLSMTDGDTIFGNSESAKKLIEEWEQESGAGPGTSFDQSRRIDGQIVTDSEEGDTDDDDDDDGDEKDLFDPAALAALLKAATDADPDGTSSITVSSQDGSRLFSVERPAGLGPSLRALRQAPRSNQANIFTPSTVIGESEDNLSEEEKEKLEKLQKIRVKFLRLVQRLGLSSDEPVAAQVLYRLALLGGRQGTPIFNIDAAKRTALELEAEERDDLDFSVNILVLGKSGVGKSATINSIFGEEKTRINTFETGTFSPREIVGFVDGVKVHLLDTPGLKSSIMEQSLNRSVLFSVKKWTKKTTPDLVLYVDRLDSQTRYLNDLPILKTVSTVLGSSIWKNAIVTLTHGASAPPDGPSGTPLSYEVFVTQRSHVVQQSIGHAVGDLRMMGPSLMNPISLVENHPSCRKNRDGHKILPNGQIWRPQLLLLCYSMKILSEASSLSKPHDPFDHRKLFGFRTRAPPLPYMLSSILQSRAHPKLPPDQGGDGVDSDIDLDDLSDSDEEEEEDEYDQLPPFKPLRKAQMEKLSKEQKKAYFEEYDYRVKLLNKKQWRDELKRIRELKKTGKEGSTATTPFADEEEADSGGAASPVAVPLPDMALPPSFDGENPAYRYRFLEPTSQFLARPVLDSHGWDHDCGYDGVNLEHTLAVASRFPAVYTVQVTKDKKDFTFSLDSSVSVKHGENMSTMAGFDIQNMGKQLAYVVRGETKFKSFKKNRAAGGVSVTFLGENVVPGVKIEDQVTLGKQYVLVGSAGGVKSGHDTAYGANFELQRRELDYPIGQIQSTLSLSIIKWKGDLALGFNSLAQFSVGRNSKVAVRAGINNKLSGQVTVKTSSSDHLSLALAAVIPTVISIYNKLWPGAGEKYAVY